MRSRKPTILWLDDDRSFLREYAEEIDRDAHFNLVQEWNVDGALARIDEPDFEPALLIWDMMLPPGQLGHERTGHGVRTGEVFLERFRSRFPEVPTLMFSNVRSDDIFRRYNSPDDHNRARRKEDLLPGEMVLEIKSILQLADHKTDNVRGPGGKKPR